MGESVILAHPSISTLRPTTANQVLYDGPATEVNSGPHISLNRDPRRGVPMPRFGSG
jgi:hypothetical protein